MQLLLDFCTTRVFSQKTFIIYYIKIVGISRKAAMSGLQSILMSNEK
jgi:hypothetical protein